MKKHTQWKLLGFDYYRSPYIATLYFFGVTVYARSGQCRTLFGYSWVVEE